MKKRRVISGKQLPSNPPLVSTLVYWLALDKLAAPGWAWGVVGTIMAVIWIAWIVDAFNRESVEVIDRRLW